MKTTSKEAGKLYDEDFFEWTQRTAELIREGRFSEVDREHLAEEIADMGKRDRRELRSRTVRLIQHLLKWKYQPKRRCNSWLATIGEQRRRLLLLLEDSPSLRRVLEDDLGLLYSQAVRAALQEMRLPSGMEFELEKQKSELEAALAGLEQQRKLVENQILKVSAMQRRCPFSLEEILDEDFFPE
jgi:hypothetical protein